MMGRKLAERVSATGAIGGHAVGRMTLADVVAPQVATDFAGTRTALQVDLSETGSVARLIADRPDIWSIWRPGLVRQNQLEAG